jgi:ubiquinone biosynthesis protein
MPNMLHDIMQQTTQHKLKMQWESQQLEAMRQEMRRSQRINQTLIVIGILAFLGVQIFNAYS